MKIDRLQIKQQEPSAEADGSYQMADPDPAGNEYDKLEVVGFFT